MKILFDTNILLDVFLKRTPFYSSSVKLTAFAEQGRLEGWVCGTTVTTIHYLITKALTRQQAAEHVDSVLKIFHVSVINRAVLTEALSGDFNDFEDAVLYQSALQSKLDGILTRNVKDFQTSGIPVYKPVELLGALG